ncbi:MFS transporter [Phycicoccus sp. BSK3Z-2]|uniref:MFS transporter n=1 Tax=Phycicoccus avicenniae TaxID=2828860 RepID=A0A941DD86_9MICO|nr:MFS transporter [Phycicoccus avicenniae]MBR7744192.1 MFS transporter [Phycicoccus avicenniae]
MLSAYAPLFRVPGVVPFVTGTMVARVGGAMFGVAVVVMVSERQGSYGIAGAVSAVGLTALAVAGPLLGRLVDRHGQRRVALPFVGLSLLFSLATAYASATLAPVWTLFVLYAVSAFLPEPGPMSRARWAHLVGDDPDRLHTAMSFEQVADEASFVLGPVLAVLTATLWFPEAGLLLATAFFTVGMLVFLSARATEPPVFPHAERPAGLAVRWPGVLVVALVLTMTGMIFGANEVVAVAYTEAQGNSSLSSLVLGMFALGSTLAGVVVGSRRVRWPLTRRLLVAATLMCVLEVPALFVTSTWQLAVVMFVAGSATAPMLITGLSLAQRLVPPALMTEGMAVAVTGILIGIAAGSAVGGWAVEVLGPQRAYLVPVLAGLVAVVLAAVRYRALDRADTARTRTPAPVG